MASAYLTKTLGTPTNNKKFTFSCWVKKSGTSGTMDIFHAGSSGADEAIMCRFESNGQLTLKHDVGNSQEMLKQSTALYRDTNAWYHIVVVFDTDNSTAEDRQIIYVNGERITDWASSDNFAGGEDILANKAVSHTIGKRNFDSANYLDGVLTHVHFADGQAYAPTVFGETDATTGIWKPKVSPSVTYGNNGFFLKFDNSANMGLDSSGNSNNWTTNGTIIQNKDTPSNVFATLNPLDLQTSSPPTIINVNNTISAIGDNDNVSTTLGGSFKWYYEAKILQNPDGSNGYGAGVGACHIDTFNYEGWAAGNRTGFQNSDTKWYSNSLSGAGRFVQGGGNQIVGGLTQATAGDIVGVACDAANGRVYIHINGTYQNSGDPVNGTGFIGGTAGKTGLWFPWFSSDNTQGTVNVNFGNGYFGTTAVTSAQNPDDGNGIFEYDVPAGYRAICTKSINAEEYS